MWHLHHVLFRIPSSVLGSSNSSSVVSGDGNSHSGDSVSDALTAHTHVQFVLGRCQPKSIPSYLLLNVNSFIGNYTFFFSHTQFIISLPPNSSSCDVINHCALSRRKYDWRVIASAQPTHDDDSRNNGLMDVSSNLGIFDSKFEENGECGALEIWEIIFVTIFLEKFVRTKMNFQLLSSIYLYLNRSKSMHYAPA